MTRYLANRPAPQPLLVLVDGDAFEVGNLSRQACTVGDLGTNKAEALARVARSVGLGVQVVAEHVTAANVGYLVRDGDIVLLAVDNHPARALLDRHVATLLEATEEHREPGCQVLAAEHPQLLVTNLMVASAMLNALWQVVEYGSVPYSEVYLDVTQCAARPRRWFRLEAGAQ